MRARPKCIDVAPQGDLVVAVDSGPARRLAKISSTIIKLASPVFRAMLGPSFKEGQAAHDASNPLSLPDDDATSMLNLFHILHYNGDKAKKTEDDWIQKLVVVCDKYECTESLKTYLHFQLSQCSFVSTLDRFIISGLIDDRSRFERLSEQIVRMPKHQAQFAAHQGILHLSPANMLDKMKVYRRRARTVYRDQAVQLTTKLFYSDYIEDHELCPGLKQRLLLINETLIKKDILLPDNVMDFALPNMKDVLSQTPFYDTVEYAAIDDYTCEETCEGCEESVGDMARDIAKCLKWGTKEHCTVCLECFKAREFKFAYECAVHK